MKVWTMVAAGAAALALAGCGGDTTSTGNAVSTAPLTQIEAPNGDWTEVVAQTPEGGYLMGNPDAPVKLVEYASMTCPHCATFSRSASEQLKNEYVKSGQVSFEFRNFVLNAVDLGASMLARCQEPRAFFRMTEQLFAEQDQWLAGYQAIPEAEQQRIASLPEAQQVGALAKAGGVDAFFRKRGVPEARVDQCLGDPANLQRLVDMSEAAGREGITGTPAFKINGELLQGVSSWDQVEPRIRQAIG